MTESDQRKSRRRPIRYYAEIGTVGGEGCLPCLVKDVSETGARVATHSPDQLPDRFILRLTNEGALQRVCKVVWRSETEAGVTFVKPPRRREVTEMGVAASPSI
jgi:hypothetical protein